MLNAFFPLYLQCLLLISVFSSVYILQELQPQYARATNDFSQRTHIIPVHATAADILANNGEVSNPDAAAENASAISQIQEQSTSAAVKNFQDAFCGIDD